MTSSSGSKSSGIKNCRRTSSSGKLLLMGVPVSRILLSHVRCSRCRYRDEPEECHRLFLHTCLITSILDAMSLIQDHHFEVEP
eukprot:749176-Hanusia_phi.AAC.3